MVCYTSLWHGFHFIVTLYNIKMFKSIPASIVSWLGKSILMHNYWLSRSVLRWMALVRNREIRNMVLLSTFALLLTWVFFVLNIFISLMCVWLEKLLYCLFVYRNESNRLFSPRWIGSSNLKIWFVTCIKNWMFCWENWIRIPIFLKLYSSLLLKKHWSENVLPEERQKWCTVHPTFRSQARGHVGVACL